MKFQQNKEIRKCPLCKSSNILYLFDGRDRLYDFPGIFWVSRCTSCGFQWSEPQLSDKQLSKYYPQASYYSYKDGTKRNFFAKLRTFIIQEYGRGTVLGSFLYFLFPIPGLPDIRKKGAILDIGCGSGDTLSLLSDFGWTTWGIEPDKRAVRFARTRGITNVIVGSHKKISNIRKELFDVVRLYSVLEHIDNPLYALSLAYRVLKTEGEIIIGIPNAKSVMARLFGTYWYNLDVPRHRYHFTPKTIKKILAHSGFSDTRISFHSAGGLLGSIGHVLKHRFGISNTLITNTPLFLLFYPIEWLFDCLGAGDMMVITAKKDR